MKKLFLVMTVICMFAGMAFALTPQEIKGAKIGEASALWKTGKWAEAEVKYREAEKIEYEGYQSGVYFGLGYCLERQGKFEEAIAEYKKSPNIADRFLIPEATTIVTCFVRAGNLYQKELNDKAKAQEAYLQVLKFKNADPAILTKVVSDYLDKAYLGKAKYIEALEGVLLITNATEENAEFLGVVKSEIEKLR